MAAGGLLGSVATAGALSTIPLDFSQAADITTSESLYSFGGLLAPEDALESSPDIISYSPYPLEGGLENLGEDLTLSEVASFLTPESSVVTMPATEGIFASIWEGLTLSEVAEGAAAVALLPFGL
jgi:hypothetical protein